MSLLIEDYSDKAIVVRGEKTKECKETLKELGGKYNANLICGAGWIFSKKQKAKVEEKLKPFLGSGDSVEKVPEKKDDLLAEKRASLAERLKLAR